MGTVPNAMANQQHRDDVAPATKKQRIALLIQRGTDMANAQRQREDQQSKRQPMVAPSPAPPASLTRSTRWTAQDDAKLRGLVDRFGASDWRRVAAEFVPSRDRKRCRERYVNHIAPSLQKAPWKPEEDARLAALHGELGPKWAQIARRMGGRGPDDVKNRLRVVSDMERRGAASNIKETAAQSWPREETEALRELVRKHGPRNWLLIASQLSGGRTDQQCMQHWYRVANEAIVKGKSSWASEEDALLLAKVQELGQNWAKVRLTLAAWPYESLQVALMFVRACSIRRDNSRLPGSCLVG